LCEFGLGDTAIFAGVDLVEDEPVVSVLLQVLDEVFELGLGDVVVAVFGCGLE
jgi:hypothetical protein